MHTYALTKSHQTHVSHVSEDLNQGLSIVEKTILIILPPHFK